MECPYCGASALKQETRDLPYIYKGQETVIKGITGEFCGNCHESIIDGAQTDKLLGGMQSFRREVNRKEVEPTLILTYRRKLGLDQRQAAEIFGGGANAFSRYETGAATPPKSLVLLLGLLDKHPELIDEVVSVSQA